MHDRDRRAPVPLPGQQPVPQPVGDGGVAVPVEQQILGDGLDGGGLVQPVVRPRVHHRAVSGGCHAGNRRIVFAGVDDHLHRQVERPGEIEVALVVGRHRHHRTGAVVGQHVVRGVHRNPRAVDRIDGVAVQEHTGLGPVGGQPVDVGQRLDLLAVGDERRLGAAAGGQLLGQRGVGGHDEEGRAVQRVRAGGEDPYRRLPPLDGEVDVRPGGPADPVALHREDALRPLAMQRGHVVE